MPTKWVFQPKDIEKLAEIIKSLADGIVTPAIKRLIPDNAIEFHRVLLRTLALTHVTLERQKEIVDESIDSKNPRKSIGNAFSAIKDALPQPKKVVVKKTKKPLSDVLLQLGYKFVTALQQEEFEDVEDDVKQRINEYATLAVKLSATAPTEEDIEADEIIAEVEAEEAEATQEKEKYDTAASY